MAAPSLTYTLSNGTTADASQVMQNFTDLLNAMTDGTKDLSISALTCAGAATLNGNVQIGNASSDDFLMTSSLASSVPIKTQRSFDIGGVDTGLRTMYLGGNSTHTVALQAPSSGLSGDITFQVPPSNGTANYLLTTNGSGVADWTSWTASAFQATGTALGTVQSYSPSVSSSYALKTNTDYTGTTSDGLLVVGFSTGNTSRTYTPPAAASSTGRVIKITKTDTGTGMVIVDLANDYKLFQAGTSIEIVSDGSNWLVSGGKPVGLWESFTPTWGNFGTPTTVFMEWRQNHQLCEVRGEFIPSSVGGGSASITNPNSLAINWVSGNNMHIGTLTQNTTINRNTVWILGANTNTLVNIGDGIGDGAHNPQTAANSNILVASVRTTVLYSFNVFGV